MTAAILLIGAWNNHMGSWGTGWWILMVVVWGLLVVGIVWLVQSVMGGQRRRTQSVSEVLDQRLASGEISLDEYRRRQEALRGTRGRESGEP